jgi:glutamate carboxypeptidase
MDNEVVALQAALAGRLPAALSFLRALVGINSYTGNRDGVNQVGRATAEGFAALGFEPEFVPHRDPACGDHLVLRRPGRGGRVIAMISHHDTVFPPEEEARNDFRWQAEGDRIYGPGTVDIKGGTVMMWLTLRGLFETAPEAADAVEWVLLWNASEETLSEDFADVCRKRLDPAATLGALVFESEGRPRGRPSVVVARKGRATFRVTVTGRASHAGAKHPRGANAITQIGRVVDRIAGLTDYSRDLTFNVGTIRGGVALNRVPHEAVAEVEMRAFLPEVYQQGKSAILGLNGPGDVRSAVDQHACHVSVECLSESPPWPRNPGTEKLYAIWRSAAEALGETLDAEERGGLSDGNWIHDWVPTLDGLGPHGDNDHCSERSADGSKVPEYVHVPSILPKALLNARALRRLIDESR